MYKVFLVDDEIVVREGIRSNFPWDKTEFVLAGEAPDGEIALSMLQDVKPDILITDIRMPFMDGLALCRQVSRTMPWVYIIILSGHDDFAYAREAISLGVKEYLLKPVSGQELLGVLEGIALRIEDDKRQQASLRAYREQLASSSRFMKEKLLLDLYAGANSERILKSARSLQMNLLANNYLVICMQPANEPPAGALADAHSVLQRLADGSGGTAHLCEAYGGFTLLVLGDNPDDLEERAYGLAQSACFDVKRNTGIHLLAGVGVHVTALSEIPHSVNDARAVLDWLKKAPGGHRQIMSMQDVPQAVELSLLDLDVVAPISQQLRHASVEDVDAILDHYTKSMGDSSTQSVMMANYFFVDIMLETSRIIRDNHGVPQEIIPAAFRAQKHNALLQPEEVLPLCRYMLERAIVFRDSQGSTRYGGVMRKAKAFISENYTDSNLTLHDVASHVALSNNHFCTVFSQESGGVTFTEYLTSLRISKAKELLSTSAMRTSEIAYAVGYNDPHYFSYLFKKNTGLSPRDFRKDDRIG